MFPERVEEPHSCFSWTISCTIGIGSECPVFTKRRLTPDESIPDTRALRSLSGGGSGAHVDRLRVCPAPSTAGGIHSQWPWRLHGPGHPPRPSGLWRAVCVTLPMCPRGGCWGRGRPGLTRPAVCVPSTPARLGPLCRIRLWHDGHGPCPAWYVSHVMVQELGARPAPRWLFPAECWLAVDRADGRVQRELACLRRGPGFWKVGACWPAGGMWCGPCFSVATLQKSRRPVVWAAN